MPGRNEYRVDRTTLWPDDQALFQSIGAKNRADAEKIAAHLAIEGLETASIERLACDVLLSQEEGLSPPEMRLIKIIDIAI